MVSVNNVSSNAFALSALRKINSDLSTTQNRIATGLKVASASDNASSWSVATTLRSEVAAKDAVTGGIAIVKAQADTASAALDTINDLLSSIQEKAVAGQATGADYASIKAEVEALQTQITAVVDGANFKGENWLNAATATKKAVVDITDGTAKEVTFSTSDMKTATTDLGKVVAATAMTDATDFATLAGLVTTAQSTVTTYAAQVAGFSKTLEIQTDFLNKLNDIRNTAISSLVDADMEEESAKVSALQVKQQLAYQALSIGNSSSQNVLRLFQ